MKSPYTHPMRRIYMDYNATTPLHPEAIAAVTMALQETGNASSIHGHGRAARKIVEDAREEIAALARVNAAQVIFNSGATEGNNTVLSGYRDHPVFIGATEHPSVIAPAPSAQKIPVTKDGVLDLLAFEKMIAVQKPALIAVQLVNSETGVVQPLAEISQRAKDAGALVLCDAVQASGRMEIDFKELGADYLTLSAHKFGGPQGVGALIFRNGLQIPKFMAGGGQEKRQRAGTENVAGIAGFGAAAKLARVDIAAYQTRVGALRDQLERGLRTIANDLVIIGADAPRVCNTTGALLPGVSAETQLMGMDLEGISLSSGSACSSGAFKSSHVLTAMEYSEDDAKSALRFSIGWATTSADIEETLAAFRRLVERVRK